MAFLQGTLVPPKGWRRGGGGASCTVENIYTSRLQEPGKEGTKGHTSDSEVETVNWWWWRRGL